MHNQYFLTWLFSEIMLFVEVTEKISYKILPTKTPNYKTLMKTRSYCCNVKLLIVSEYFFSSKKQNKY